MRQAIVSFYYKYLKKDAHLNVYNEVYNGNQDLNQLKKIQLERFKKLFSYSKNNIPYYKEVFTQLKLNAEDFKTLEDLKYIPVLEKQTIIDNYNLFSPNAFIENYYLGSTGGSTGNSFKYRISNTCGKYASALLERGYSYAGYKQYDKILTLAGGSLVKNSNQSKSKQIQNFLFNRKSYSSFGLGEKELHEFIQLFERFKPKFIRGYANSLYLLAQFIKEKDIHLKHKVNALFSTAEMLFPRQRKYIENVFGTKIFNQYGLNDGAISAFENNEHNGFLIDTERGIMEVVNEEGINIKNESGIILGTSLHNYAFPFIRYNTKDIGTITDEFLNKNNIRERLVNLYGRATDILEINNKKIGSPVLTVLMGKTDVLRYQFVQDENKIRLILDVLRTFTSDQENFIRTSLYSNLGEFELIFDYSKNFIDSKNKHKFIIRK